MDSAHVSPVLLRAQINVCDLRDAVVVYNGIAFGMRTMSGCGIAGVDDAGATHFLAPGVSNEMLGAALHDCLQHSRLFDQKELDFFLTKEEMKRNKNSWIAAQSSNMGVTNFSNLRKKIAWVSATTVSGVLHLLPSLNSSGLKWLYLADRHSKDIQLPYPCDNETIGAALREAFRRCEGTGRADLSFEGWPDDTHRVWASPANPLKAAPPQLLVSPTRQSVTHQIKVTYGGDQSR
jgi:CDI immunity protein